VVVPRFVAVAALLVVMLDVASDPVHSPTVRTRR
jgi:hypothetical protein